MSLLEKMDLFETKTKTKCKGLFWRARTNAYMDQQGKITVRKELRLLKRKSCSGCEDCAWFIDYMREDISLMDEADKYLDHIEEGSVYTYKIHCSKGYYDLYEEIEGVEFIKIDEEIKPTAGGNTCCQK